MPMTTSTRRQASLARLYAAQPTATLLRWHADAADDINTGLEGDPTELLALAAAITGRGASLPLPSAV